MTVELIGVPLNYGCAKTNDNVGTKHLREAEAFSAFAPGTFEDRGDLAIPALTPGDVVDKKRNYVHPVLQVNRVLAEEVAQVVERGDKPLVIGGDHSIALGSLAGLLEDGVPTAVIWIDAHGDMNIPASTETGNIHGMPLAIAMGMDREEFRQVYAHDNVIDPENVYLVGARALDPFEDDLIQETGVHLYPAAALLDRDMSAVAEEIIAHIEAKALPRVHISLDIDVMDPAFVPAVSTPVKGGMTEDQVHTLLQLLLSRLPVWSMDVVEYHPDADEDDMTLGVMKRLMDVIAEGWSRAPQLDKEETFHSPKLP